MQLQTVVILVAGLAASASASIPANPVVKHLPARAINLDGTFGGLIFKRQSGCPDGYTACGTGCSAGQCCNADAGLACRVGEACTEVNGETGCCPGGYTCNSILGCQNAVGTGCTPGSITNGLLCCDATAPMCGSNNGVPYCAGAVPNSVYTINPTGVFDSTSTSTVSITATETLTLTSTSDAVSTTDSTDTASVTTTETEVITSTETASITSTTTFSSESDVFTIQTSLPTVLPTLSLESTSTLTSTIVVYPTGNGTGNATATATVSPPEATGAASRFGVSGFALTILMGLAFAL